jgi:hypothetical protein
LVATLACGLLLVSPLPAQSKANASGPDRAVTAFDTLADRALLAMRQRAAELKVTGVAVVAFAPGGEVASWSSRMLVVGHLTNPPTPGNKGDNLLGIAYAKLSEMAATLQNSGSGTRPPLTGEFGWQGGVVASGRTGRFFAAFSGGPSEDDVRISQAGLAILQADQ